MRSDRAPKREHGGTARGQALGGHACGRREPFLVGMQQVPVTEPNTAHEQLPTGTGGAIWYCHSPGPNLGANDPKFVVQ